MQIGFMYVNNINLLKSVYAGLICYIVYVNIRTVFIFDI